MPSPKNPFESLQISYVGLPASRCPNCKGGEFARVGRDLKCLSCDPTSTADEWLRGAFAGGLLRWAKGLPPHDSSQATRWLYVAVDLDSFDVEPSRDARESVWGPLSPWHYREQWYHRLSMPYVAWLGRQICDLERHAFPDDFDEAKSQLGVIVERGIEFGQLPPTAGETETWPEPPLALADLFAEAAEIDEVTAWSLKVLPPDPKVGELGCRRA